MSPRTSRRRFLQTCSAAGLTGLGGAWPLASAVGSDRRSEAALKALETGALRAHPALFYEKRDEDAVQCGLCPNRCLMAEGERGNCRARMNRNGELISLVYGKPCSVHVDPIEKKPLYHFLPGSSILSIATAGCVLSCEYCQNWQISQAWPEETRNTDLPPEALVKATERHHSRSIAYTYTEPTVFYEYMIDSARLARERGLHTVSVTCGYINREPLAELCPFLSAANIDLKGFTEDFYRSNSSGSLQPVLDAIVQMKSAGVHVELTTLIVPTRNDDMRLIRKMCAWIRNEVGADTPLHFSRFHPQYKLRHLPPTPQATLEQARETALEEQLEFVYLGNVPGSPYNSTYCPGCGARVIHRVGYRILGRNQNPETGACGSCGRTLAGVWN